MTLAPEDLIAISEQHKAEKLELLDKVIERVSQMHGHWLYTEEGKEPSMRKGPKGAYLHAYDVKEVIFQFKSEIENE